ncbi:MAG: hypothetical protein RLZZ182_1675 [Pseudomonadota bacterium]|jgi:SAM-dependent methyltransferase
MTAVPTPHTCHVCASPVSDLLYESEAGQSLTSLCQVREGRTQVYACRACGHLQTPEMPDAAAYYESDYGILVNSEEEDQIYDMHPVHGTTYRTQHQARTLLAKLDLPAGARVLDYGCAKSSTMKLLAEQRPDLQPHLFDVSARYQPFWSRFLTPERWAVHEVPTHWQGHFDVVTSFFSLEHMVQPRQSIQQIAQLIRPGGTFYAIVPNVLTNVSDFIVLDHVNHFSVPSLQVLLADAGLEVVDIDDQAHRGAFVVVARRAAPTFDRQSPVHHRAMAEVLDRFQTIGAFWQKASQKVRAFEQGLTADQPLAIYGAGVYGAFLVSCLQHPQRVRCHLDQNPFLQGQQVNGRPIVAPADLPRDVAALLVGLNPAHARRIISDVPALQGLGIPFFFLD